MAFPFKYQILSDQQHVDSALAMILSLWPESDAEDEKKEIQRIMSSEHDEIILALENGKLIGLVIVSLRHDYVEGTTTSPVAYLEGLYVEPAFRRQGVAQQLVDEAAKWGATHHCSELASDAEVHNTASIQFHHQCGFSEANRIICFTRPIKQVL